MQQIETRPQPALARLTAAYESGDAPRGERLLIEALDHDLPWDEVCSAVARGVARRFGGQPRA